MRFRLFFIMLILVMIVPLALSQQTNDLDGTEWHLVSIGRDNLAAEGITVTLEFGTNSFGGYMGCNSYFGTYALSDNGVVKFTDIFTTDMACIPAMAPEAFYVDLLASATGYDIIDGQLVITGDQTLVFDPAPTLPNTQWRLLSIDGTAANSTITLHFDTESKIAGKACNYYGGTYTAAPDTLAFGEIERTEMACLEAGVMQQEEAYFAALQSATGYVFEGDTLTINYGEEGATLVFERLLDQTTWQLESIGDTAVSAQITLQFDDADNVSGLGGCNQYSSGYIVAGDTIRFETITSTRMACENVMELENAYFTALQAAERYELIGDTLTITTTSGETLVFVPSEIITR
jgi:heat shock protein HslJ